MKNLQIAIVEWEDACGYINKELHEVDNDKPNLVKTYGILVKTNKYYIVMTHDGNGNDNSDFMKIPKCLVRKVTYLIPKK